MSILSANEGAEQGQGVRKHPGVSLLLRLLNLPTGRRLVLVLGMIVVSLGLYGLVFPATYFAGVLLLPLLSATWLFGWRGGLLCLAGLTLILGVYSDLASGSAPWHSLWLIPFVTGTLYGLAVCLAIGALRRITKVLLGAQQSIAQVHQAYQQERALNEWKDKALQNLSHELRGSLTQTDGYLELLETYRDNLDAATQARFIAFARSGCEELLSLTMAALETAQASEAQPPLHLSTFSLRHEVQTVLAHCVPRLLQDHPIEVDIAESTQVYADAHFVQQIVRNLLTNACKYTPAQTPIVVSVAPMSATDSSFAQAGLLCVRVQDWGPGIPPEQQAFLFQRFVRLPNATASRQPGSGLGLAICKQLVEAIGGSIWVESTGRNGEGCCFSFTLPGIPDGGEGQMKHQGENYDEAAESVTNPR